MLKTLMDNANLWSEAQRTNVRWVLLAVVCLAALVVWACGSDEFEELIRTWEECMTDPTTPEVTPERAEEVMLKHKDLFLRQPGFQGLGAGSIEDEDWNAIEGLIGITLTVTEIVDQSTLPSEDRIPDCLEGVPVKFEVGFHRLLQGFGGGVR